MGRRESVNLGAIILALLGVIAILDALPPGWAGLFWVIGLALVGLFLMAWMWGGRGGRGGLSLTSPFWFVVPLVWLLRRRPHPPRPGARWAGLFDLWRAGWLRAEGGWPLGRGRFIGGIVQPMVYLPAVRQRQNVMVVAPNGQGKTLSCAIPVIYAEAWADRSDVFVDPKGDLRPHVEAALSGTHEVLVWNPSRPEDCTVAFDPLSTIPPSDHPRFVAACELAATIYLAATSGTPEAAGRVDAGDRFWVAQASSLLKGVIMIRREAHPEETLRDVARYFADVPAQLILKQMKASKTPAAQLRGQALEALLLNPNAAGAVIGDLLDRFVVLLDPRLERVLGRSDLPLFDVNRFMERPTALVLQVDALTDATLPLLSVALATLTGQLVQRCTGGVPAERDVRILIDEAGNLGKIHGLPTSLAILRSYGISHMTIWQALAQARQIYGQAGAESIINNSVTSLVLGGTADEDAEWISRRLARDIDYKRMPHDSRRERSYSYSKDEIPLLRPDEIRHMAWKVIVDSAHIHPCLLDMEPHT